MGAPPVRTDSRRFPEVFSNREIAAVVTLTIGSGMIRALQPLLLGALVHEQPLTVAELGLATTLELLAIGINIGAAATWLKTDRLRTIHHEAVINYAAFNLGLAFDSQFIIMLFRAHCGLLFCIGPLMVFGYDRGVHV